MKIAVLDGIQNLSIYINCINDMELGYVHIFQ